MDIRVFADEAGLAEAVAGAVSETIARVVNERGRCMLALSGGSTPSRLYRVLASDFRDKTPWGLVQIFWVDERFVPPSDPQSNYGMARSTLLNDVPCPVQNIHPIPTDLPTPAEAAEAYSATLRRHFGDGPPQFDLMLLGIGEDGHTASLFPHSPALTSADTVAAAPAPASTDGANWRVTFTFPVLLAARTVFVVASGARKSAAIARALSATSTPDDCPASALRSAAGHVVWWMDHAAAPIIRG